MLGDFSAKEGLNPRSRPVNEPHPHKAKPSFDDEPIVVSKKKKRSIWPFRRKNKPPMSKKRKIITGILIFLFLVLGIGGFLALKGYINLHKVLKGGGGAAALESNVDPSKLKGEGDGRVNILLLGRGGDENDAPDLTDTIIVASIDPIANEAVLFSIPRDLYVPVSGSGSMKINAAFATGKNAELSKVNSKQRNTPENQKKGDEAGFTKLEETIETNLGVNIHYHTLVDFAAFRQAVDTVGGIDINVPSPVAENMRIDGKPYRLDVKAGQQHMDGFKALAYSRTRHTSARGDFDRAERQRLVIIALKEKILSAGTFSNPAKISSLLDNLGSHVTTNFSLEDMKRLYQLGGQISQQKITSVGLADPPNNFVVTDSIAGQSVVVPRAGVGKYTEIKAYLRNVLKDSYIKNENANVMVLNGTGTAGLATQKADELKGYGYNVGTVDNAPTRAYTKTVIVDLRNGSKKYTKNYLEKRYGVSAVTALPDTTIQPGVADFVIIIGNDQANSAASTTR